MANTRNNDPMPWRNYWGDRFLTEHGHPEKGDLWDPRPEFDMPAVETVNGYTVPLDPALDSPDCCE